MYDSLFKHKIYTGILYILCGIQNNSLIFYTKYYDWLGFILKTCFVEMY